MNNFYKDLPPWAKGVVVVSAIGATAGLYFAIKNAIKNAQAKSLEKEFQKEIQAEKQTFESAGEKLTYPPSNYVTFADQIQEAMQYTGTYFSTIYSIMYKMKNNLDVLQLNKAWGTREIYFWGFTYNFTLPEALRDELDPEDIAKINSLFKARGIKYQY